MTRGWLKNSVISSMEIVVTDETGWETEKVLRWKPIVSAVIRSMLVVEHSIEFVYLVTSLLQFIGLSCLSLSQNAVQTLL